MLKFARLDILLLAIFQLLPAVQVISELNCTDDIILLTYFMQSLQVPTPSCCAIPLRSVISSATLSDRPWGLNKYFTCLMQTAVTSAGSQLSNYISQITSLMLGRKWYMVHAQWVKLKVAVVCKNTNNMSSSTSYIYVHYPIISSCCQPSYMDNLPDEVTWRWHYPMQTVYRQLKALLFIKIHSV